MIFCGLDWSSSHLLQWMRASKPAGRFKDEEISILEGSYSPYYSVVTKNLLDVRQFGHIKL